MATRSPADEVEVGPGPRWFTVLGVLWIILGALAILVPFAATLAAEILIGTLVLIGGVAQVVHAFRSRGWRGFIWHLLVGLLAVALGVLLLVYPLHGVLTLTLLLAAFFLADGILRILAGFGLRGHHGSGWMIVNGVLSVIIAIVIWSGWPGTALWVLGLLVGIQLIFSGIVLIVIGRGVRRLARA